MDTANLQAPTDHPSENEAKSATRPRPKVVRHTHGSTKILKQWFALHSDYPYPNDDEKGSLASETGLTTRQISYWFTNARRRRSTSLSACSSSSTSASSLPARSHPSGESMADASPLDRWRHTPPDQEGASLAAIARALETSRLAGSEPSLPLSSCEPETERPLVGARPSVSSVGSWNDVISRSGSDSSTQSRSSTSTTSVRSHGRRRRRPRVSHLAARACSGERVKRPYQCTFCTDTFKTRYDWTRHEGTLHLVLETWTCLPSGPTYRCSGEARPRCALCDLDDPPECHLQSHTFGDCLAKPHSARTFYRKDHLRQHLRLSHGIQAMLPSMNEWKSRALRIKSRCGFCGENFSLWTDRNDHLAEHFRSGAMMRDWKGCRGLEPHVALLVENAMPPYLIGIEANDLQPFSASRLATETNGTGVVNNGGPRTPFETLVARLGDFVKVARESGVPITDELLRKEARLILFGDEDPWNQTPADNAEWLALFKQGYGLLATSTTCTIGTSMKPLANNSCGPDPTLGVHRSPFTLENMRRAAFGPASLGPSGACGALLNDVNVNQEQASGCAVPWAWQTPECLAEFSQMCNGEQMALAFQTGTGNSDMNSTDNPVDAQENDLLSSQQGDAGFNIPWAWQTPECLAEFSQMCEMKQADAASSTADLNFDMIFPS